MAALEIPVLMECAGSRMIGVFHPASEATHRGVLLVVGGPQYRIGSHRQFLLLARYLAAHGIPIFRFDYRGMGDSEGRQRTFEEIDEDISIALDEFCHRVPAMREVVIWGLCDAASAALMFASRDARVSGLILVNPWLRSEATLAKTHLKHYYISRLGDRDFWKKIFSGRVNPVSVATELFLTIMKSAGFRSARNSHNSEAAEHGDETSDRGVFTDRMREGFAHFKGPVLIVLSGDDLTAAEFRDEVSSTKHWKDLLSRRDVTQIEVPEANHTFSRRSWHDKVASNTVEWVRSW